MDLSIFGYQFMQNAITATLLGGIACGIIGVFVVLLHMPFIGVAMSHAAFAGALLGLWLGFDPLIGAFVFCLGAAAVIGPLADRGQLSPETSLGVVFSLMLGLAFLFIGIIPNTRSAALDLLWGSILTISRGDIVLLGIVAFLVVGMVIVFGKEIQATIFNRNVALAVGIPATLVLYSIIFLTGATITVTLRSIGGLLIFSLILNPAAAAYQLTYSMKRMFLISAGFGVLSCWIGLFFSYVLNIPSGATIVITSSLIFMLAAIFSPKRKMKRLETKNSPGDETMTSRILTAKQTYGMRRLRKRIPASLKVWLRTSIFNRVPQYWMSAREPGYLFLFSLRKLAIKASWSAWTLLRRCWRKPGQKNFKGNIEYVCSDISSTQFGDEVFDAVVCYSSFPHFHDKSKALKEINRVLKKGGKLFHLSYFQQIRYQRNPPYRFRNYPTDLIPDNEEMQQLLLSAGFSQISIHDEASSYLAKAEKL